LRFGKQFDLWSKRVVLNYAPAGLALAAIPLVWVYQTFNGVRSDVLIVAVCLMPLMSVMDARRNYFISMSRPGSVFSLDAVRAGCSVACLFLFLKSGMPGARAPITALCFSTLLCLIAVPARTARDKHDESLRINYQHFLYGFWVAWWMVVLCAFPFFERLILERRFGIEAAGTYASIADPLSAITSATGSVLISALMPRFVSAWENRKPSAVRRLIAYGVTGVILSQLACVLTGMFVIYGNSGHWSELLRANTKLALMLLLATGVWQVTVFFHKRLELKTRTLSMLVSIGVAMCGFFILVYPLVELFGLAGVAIAKIISGFIYMVFVEYFSRQGELFHEH